MSLNNHGQEEYVYEKLGEGDSIRLVKLLPASKSYAPISCELFHTTLSSSAVECYHVAKYSDPFVYPVAGYTALSYTWGDPKNTLPIILNGYSLDITANLESALRHVRQPDKAINIWADAICINQDNVLERNQQVRQMCSIYSNAATTIVYLGEATDLSTSAFNRFFTPGCFSKEESRHLVGRPWFTRVWVFQEIVVSKRPWVYCGTQRLPWLKFSPMLTSDNSRSNLPIFFDENLSRNVATTLVVEHINQARAGYGQNGSAGAVGKYELLDKLIRRRGFEASDPRDIVFALTGIIRRKGEDQMVVVDYTKSWEQVYNETAASIMAIQQDYLVLTFLDGFGYGIFEKLASWAPDWRSQDFKDYALPPLARGLDANDSMDCDFHPKNGIIACRGERKRDVVRFVSPVMRRKAMDTISVPPDFWIWSKTRIQEKKAQCYQHWKDAYNSWREVIGHHILPPYKVEPKDFSEGPFGLPDTIGTESSVSRRSVLHLLVNRTMFNDESSQLDGRRVALMKSGRLETVPARAAEGDIACRFTGSRNLLILHPIQIEISPGLDREIRAHFEDRVTVYGHFKLAGTCLLDTFSPVPPADVCYILH